MEVSANRPFQRQHGGITSAPWQRQPPRRAARQRNRFLRELSRCCGAFLSFVPLQCPPLLVFFYFFFASLSASRPSSSAQRARRQRQREKTSGNNDRSAALRLPAAGSLAIRSHLAEKVRRSPSAAAVLCGGFPPPCPTSVCLARKSVVRMRARAERAEVLPTKQQRNDDRRLRAGISRLSSVAAFVTCLP